ncbi:MAG: S8 family serine peptidase [Caldilineaceae bacterium]|nr:S8 family serine peptidase [Caldilineaceae bacterium]MBP8107708.1 S8 family serine peptidase [Caldilineaceae bacterium]MBP8122873.1 S8 family serine peptidase [Caldilineaceae bacterium]MBP9071267.1 S8 family serine peptidase [Caldilineaceae bacterium]
MRRIVLLVFCFILLAPVVAPGRLTAAQINDQPTGLLVQVSAEPGGDEADLRATLDRLAQAQGMRVVRVWPHLRAGLLHPGADLTSVAIPDAQITTARQQALMADPAVVLVELDAPVYAADGWPARSVSAQAGIFDQPNDPSLPEQYALSRINAFGGWGISQGSPAMTVAVIDSGYDLDHEDIDPASAWVNQAEAVGLPDVDDDNNGYVDDINGWDFIEHDGVTNDPYGHGTHVGGVIGAATDNGVGVASVGRNLRVMPLRILDQTGRGSISGLLDALAYATAQGVRVINLSLVTTTDSATLHAGIQAVASQGILLVAASGNAGASVNSYFPAAWAEVFTVAATDSADKVTLFSNYGEAIDVGAPGSAIISTYKNNSYYSNSGTSMATPHVSALAGLLLSLRPDLSLVQLTDLIRATAEDVNAINYPGRDNYLGDGRIDLLAALSAASSGLVFSTEADTPLPFQETGEIKIRVETTNGIPSQGTIVTYTLFHQEGSRLTNATLTGDLITNLEGKGVISATVPLSQNISALNLVAGQATTTFLAGSPASILISSHPSQVIADGISTSVVMVKVKDIFASPIPNQIVTFTTSLGSVTNLAMTNASGIASGTLTSGIIPGAAVVTATVDMIHKNTTINLVAGPPASIVMTSHLSLIIADGSSTSVITATVKDVFENPIPNQVITFTTNLGSITSSALTNDRGIASGTLTSGTAPGTAVVTAVVNTISESTTVIFAVGSPASIFMTSHPSQIVANGISTSMVTATVKDIFDNPVPNQVVTFATNLGSVNNAALTNARGIAIGTLTAGTVTGIAIVTARAGDARADIEVDLVRNRIYLPSIFLERLNNLRAK